MTAQDNDRMRKQNRDTQLQQAFAGIADQTYTAALAASKREQQTRPPVPTPPPVSAPPADSVPVTVAAPSSNTPAPTKRQRVRGLDGMRAIAALAVLVYHYLPTLAPGGLLGVDVFFVLSGFLITGLLAAEYERNGKINIRRFWVRRFRRLVPAVTITVLTCVSVAYFVSRDLLVGIRSQVLGALTFTFNWFDIASGQSYFTDANPQLLRNMWSLAVEQQFYVIWPLILLLLVFPLKRKLRWVMPLMIAGVATATMGLLYAHGASATRVYEGTFTHSMGLMLGAMLALLGYGVFSGERGRISTAKRQLRGTIGWLGLILVAVMFFALPKSPQLLYPWAFLIASLATVAIVQALFPEVIGGTGSGRALMQMLELRPLTWLGERSYSLYLWHWPVFLIVNSFAGLNNYLVAAIASAISLTAAVLSYRFVETPMRKNGVFRTLGNGFTRICGDWTAPTAPSIFRRLGYLAVGVFALSLPTLTATALVNPPQKTGAQENVERGAQALAQHQRQLAAGKLKAASGTATAAKAQSPLAKEIAVVARDLVPPPPKPKPKPEYPSPLAPNTVTIVGDSVTLASAEALIKVLPTASVDAKVSRSSVAGLTIVKDLKARGQLRPYLVFSLATNSDFTLAQGRDLMSVLGPKERVVFVTGFGPRSEPWIFRSNETMRELEKIYPAQVRIANWEDAIRDKQNLLASDHVHPDGRGARIYADLVLQALKSFP